MDQSELETWFRELHGTELWTTLYRLDPLGDGLSVMLFSCLIPLDRWERSRTDPSWDLSLEGGMPGFIQHDRDGARITSYEPYGSLDGIEPLVLVTRYRNQRENSAQVVGEFRNLFRLYEDRTTQSFYYIEDDGAETEVVRTGEDGSIEVRTALLRRYLAVKQLGLELMITSDYRAPLPAGGVADLPGDRDVMSPDLCLRFWSGEQVLESGGAYSRLLGKKIVRPPDRVESDVWPYEKPSAFLDFEIGRDDVGNAIEHSCDPKRLGAPMTSKANDVQYLTFVFFDREVLRKYYENAERYVVEDGSVRHHGSWLLRVDNNHSDHVVAFLGDLGTDLPIEEQRYWRGFNRIPDDRNLSSTAFKRSYEAQFADPESPDFRFKAAYEEANQAWDAELGWPLFRKVLLADSHVLGRLRVPLAGTTSEFDDQILNLAKMLIDALNESALVAAESVEKGAKGIRKLELFLADRSYPHLERDIAFLRTLQVIRSRGAAHLKGSSFDLAVAGLNPDGLRGSFSELLEQGTRMLTAFRAWLA